MNTVNDIYAELGLARPQTQGAKNNKELSQEDFLALLTTQLANQDPFKPMEDGQFIAQMAQFSSVDSLQRLENSFSSFAAAMTSNQALQASTLVGQSVLVPADRVSLTSGGQASGEFQTDSSVSGVLLTVTDANGQTVRRVSIGDVAAGDHQWSWDGTDDNGNPVPAGDYQISITGQIGETTHQFATQVYGQVASVSLGGQDGIVLNIDGLGSINLADVRRIGG
jgi:flagellar basal-body rod modification protein FlgD